MARMTDFTRTSTLSLRHNATAALSSRPKPAVPARELERSSSQPETRERVVSSDSLLQGHSHISIMHNGETYQLRATRLGKLILTK
jgi:hemin uptake protein HemP